MTDKDVPRRDALSRQGQEAVRAYVRGSLGLVAIIAVIVGLLRHSVGAGIVTGVIGALVVGFLAIAAAIIQGVRAK